jgi:hypothetical protein
MRDREEEFIERAKERRKRIELTIPEREEGEEPATEKQIAYLKHLAPNLRGHDLSGLGKWQASSLIDDIKAQQELFSEELADEYREELLEDYSEETKKSKSTLFKKYRFYIVSIIIIIILYLLARS